MVMPGVGRRVGVTSGNAHVEIRIDALNKLSGSTGRALIASRYRGGNQMELQPTR